MKKYFIFSLGLLFMLSAQAAVWTPTPGKQWTAADEQGYSQFIATVSSDFFKKMGKPYSDLKIDCADAAYALRAYYSKVNGLPFLVSGKFGNPNTSMYDGIADENERLAKFMQYLAKENDTAEIVGYDSFPVAIQDIRAGDMFLYKIQTSPATETTPAAYTRHTYIIKRVNANGTFDVLYSTQARRDAGLPMNQIRQYTFPNPKWVPNHTGGDKNRWGFRRFKMPQYAKLSQEKSPGANLEQYTLALTLGEGFFDYVKEQRTTVKEDANGLFSRLYESLCHELYERVDVVVMGLKIRTEKNNACFDPGNYDTYSTPSRDGGILGGYKKLQVRIEQARLTGEWNTVSTEVKTLVEGIFDPNRSATTRQALKKSCEFHKSQNLNTDIATFYEALSAGKASYHPNDSLFNRWGIVTSTTAALTTCPKY